MEKENPDKPLVKNKITEGSIIKSIIFLSIPIIIGNLLQSAYQITDAFWVGRLGADAVASVALSFPIVFLIIALCGGIGLGAAVLTSQYKGAKNQDMVDSITAQAFLLALIVSVFFSIIGYIFAPGIINLFGAEKNVYAGAVSYLRITFLGLFFVFGYLVYQSIMRSVGDAKTPMYIVLGTVILNFLLDPLFIYGWKFIPAYGVAGAALATIMTQAVALIIGVFILYNGRANIKFRFVNLKPKKELIKRIVSLGIPISIEQSSRAVGALLMTGLVAGFGTIALAAYGVGGQIIGVFIVVALSLSISNSALIGQNLGAGKIERAEKIAKTSAIYGFLIFTIIGVLTFVFAPQIIAAFIPSNPDVISTGSWFIRAIALTFGVVAVNMVYIGAIRGSGNARTAMILAIFTVSTQFILAYALSKFTPLGEYGLWLSSPISNIIGLLAAAFIFYKGDWKNKKLIERPEVKERIKEECEIAECE